eukprot:g842.t1
MGDIRDILVDVAATQDASASSNDSKRKKKKKKKKNMSRELMSLIGTQGLTSLVPSTSDRNTANYYKKKRTDGKVKWRWSPFTNAARKSNDPSLQLFHWVREDMEYPDYPFAKFNRKLEIIPRYTESEYDKVLRDLHADAPGGAWTKDDTDRLFTLCKHYDLRWNVIADRFSITHDETVLKIRGEPILKRSERPTYALKERFYGAVQALYKSRQQDQKASRYDYDPRQDKARMEKLNALFDRSEADEDEEKRLRKELALLNAQLHRLEKVSAAKSKGRKNLSIAEKAFESAAPATEGPTIWLPSIRSNRKNYWRSDRLATRQTPSGPGARLIKKMEAVIAELGIPEQLMATQRICDAYDKLRQNVLKVLALQNRFRKMIANRTSAKRKAPAPTSEGVVVKEEGPDKKRGRM